MNLNIPGRSVEIIAGKLWKRLHNYGKKLTGLSEWFPGESLGLKIDGIKESN